MNAVNSVLLFILVWTITAVCQSDKDVIASCDDVTGSVGKQMNLTCSVSQQKPECCVKLYNFQYSKINNDSVICNELNPVISCKKRNNFTCHYTPTTAMKEQFRFFVQTSCGHDAKTFTVDKIGSSSVKEEDLKSKYTVTAVVVGFIIIIIITIIIIIICNKIPKFNKSCGFQKRMFLCVKQDEDNSDRPKDEINDSSV